jgi:hypothetical protein
MSEWQPVVCSIDQARRCLGGISRTKFYTSILPELEAVALGMGKCATVKIGARRMVFKDALHALIDTLAEHPRQVAAPREQPALQP